MDEELKKEDYEKILKDANILLKDALISVQVFSSTAEMARKEMSKFPLSTQKKAGRPVESSGKIVIKHPKNEVNG